jgi:hypothetical protein
MNKIKNYALIGLTFFLLLAVSIGDIFLVKYKKQKVETERVSNNYRIAKDSVRVIKGENGLLASRIEAQELNITEIKTYYKNIAADVKDMKIQLRKVTGITAFNTESTNNINTFFKDSTRITEKPVELLDYSDRWFDIRIRKEGLLAQITAISRDSLIQVVHWNRSGIFWPTRWMTKKVYYQDIKSMNPNSRITYSEWIMPVKGR